MKTKVELISDYINSGEALWKAQNRVDREAEITKQNLIERETYDKAEKALQDFIKAEKT